MKKALYILLFGAILAFTMLFILILVSCGGDAAPAVIEYIAPPTPIFTPDPAASSTPEPDPISPPPGMAVSLLTGMYISEEAAVRRPFAVVYNNETRAMPQAGLMQADILYEVLAEGVTTRLIAIFQDFDAEMIGPIRSTRHYFTYFALDHGAIMVHHGGSPMGYAAISNRSIPAVDGMRYDGSVFWRDNERRRTRGMEHSSFTSAENLLNIAEELNFNMDAAGFLGMFEFFDEPTAPQPENSALSVEVPFWGNNITRFEFDPESGLYYKYIFGNPQMDFNVDEHVSVTNVIIQITNISHIPGDTEGRRNVELVGSGHGFLATNGTYSEIYWQKDGPGEPTRWYDSDRNPLTVNRGRTWISVIHNEPVFE